MSKKAAVLSRDAVLTASARRKTVDVAVPRLGGAVRLRELTTAEMFAYRESTKDMGNDQSALHLLTLCWIDESGARLFDGEGAVESLGAIPVEVLNALSGPLLAVNGLGEDAVEAAEKNS